MKMNYTRFKHFSTIIISNFNKINSNFTPRSIFLKNKLKLSENKRSFCNAIAIKNNFKFNPKIAPVFAAAATIFSWNPFKDKSDEGNTPENELIMTIKRSILCMQREEYAKAEQMLHLALRLAQQLENKDGITYVYDVMANLAMEVEDYIKAEKLYVEVMRRLLSDGVKEDDNKILHMSSKIAHVAHELGNFDKAKQGFEWTLDKIESKLEKIKDDEDLQLLWTLVKKMYAELLFDLNLYEQAKVCFIQAYSAYTEKYGKFTDAGLMMLNNLGIICMELNDYLNAEKYLNDAMELSKDNKELQGVRGLSQAHLGLVYIKKGLINEAKKICGDAWKFGKKENDQDIENAANICLDQIKIIT